jgi:hypothetical protein
VVLFGEALPPMAMPLQLGLVEKPVLMEYLPTAIPFKMAQLYPVMLLYYYYYY